jgi:zinc protease
VGLQRPICLLLAFLFTLAPLAAQQPVSPLPEGVTFAAGVEGMNEYRLPNGLRVVLFPDPTKSNITVNITYMVGSRHEGYGETGMAHLLEHLLFMGSKNHPDIKKELQDHGSRPNGTTWLDRTNYFETFQASEENLRWALSMEADRMVNSFIAKKDLDTEMTVVRNEFEMGENSPQRVLLQKTVSAAFMWHNYGKSTIGARSDIEQVPIDRLQAFYRHFYQPDNAMLVVAGKIDEAKTLAMVKEYFGPIPKPTRELRTTYTAEPTQDGERTVTLRRAGDVQALAIVYHVPSSLNDDYPAIEIAADILGESPGGRLYKALVETKKAAWVSHFAFSLREPGYTAMMATVRTEQSLEEAKNAAIAVFDGIKEKPFTDDEANRVKSEWLKDFDLMLNDSQRTALQLSEWQAKGDWRLMFLHRDRVRKVTREDAQKAAEKYWVPSNRTVGMFVPEKEPVRAEIAPPPELEKLLEGYKGDALISKGESFEASPSNIDKRTIRGELEGGLKIAFIEKKTRGESVVANIRLRFGDLESLQGKASIGAMTGQMLMRGTSKRTREEIKQEFDRLKAQVSVSGDAEGAYVRIQTTRPNLPAVLDLVGEIFKDPSFPEKEFEQLKQQTLAGLESGKNEPQVQAMQAMQRHMNRFPKNDIRYVRSTDEQIEDAKAVTLDQVKDFYKKFYGGSKGEVAVIGDFDAENTQKQLSTLFNPWRSPATYARVPRPYQAIESKKDVIQTPDKANATWVAGVPIQIKDTDPDYPALVLGNYIFGQGMNSRLFSRVRNKEGLSYGVGSAIQAGALDDSGAFMSYAIAAPQNVPKVEASVQDELKQVIEKGYSADEVEAAKKSWLQLREVSRANDPELVGRINGYQYLDRTMAFDADIEAKVMALTPEKIQAAMKKHIDPSKLSIFRAGDFKKAEVAF